MLEKFEIKINKLKEKLGAEKLNVIYFCVFGIILLLSLQMANVYGRERQKNSDSYNRTLYNVIGYMKNAEVHVEKARITSTKKLLIATFTELLSNTNLAKEAMSTLPIGQNNMNNISKFLTQAADFTEYAIKKCADSALDDKDYEILEDINNRFIVITDTFNKIYGEVTKGSLNWNDVETIAAKELADEPNVVIDGINDMKNTFQEYEGLIYDGAFSSHLESVTPKFVQNMKVITASEAKEKAIQYVNAKWQNEQEKKEIYNVEYMGEIDGKLPLYSFQIMLKGETNNITVQVTKQGGVLYLMIQDRTVVDKNITLDKAKVIGERYLNKIGINNIKATYSMELENMITVNYAAFESRGFIISRFNKSKNCNGYR